MRFRCSNVDPPPNFKILSSYPLTFHTNAWFVCTQKPHCSSPCFKLLLSVQNEKEKKKWILYQNNSQVKVRLSVLMLNGPYSLSLYRFTKQKGTRNIIAPKRFIRQFASTHLHSWADIGTVEKKKKCLAQEHNTMTCTSLEPRPLKGCHSQPLGDCGRTMKVL